MRTRLAVVLIAVLASVSARADDRKPLPGEVMQIAELLKLLEQTLDGEIVEIELDDDDDGFVYEVYYVDGQGRRIEVEVDARSGAILKREVDD